MTRMIQIADSDDRAMINNKFDFSTTTGGIKAAVYPSDIKGLEAEDNGNVLGALDGEGVVQYAYEDVREFEIIFKDLRKSVHDAGAATLINELRDRLYKTTGSTYYLRLEPEKIDTTPFGEWVDNVLTPNAGGMEVDAYIGMDLVDSAYNTFIITDNDETTITVDLDGGSGTNGRNYVVRRDKNPLEQSAPIKVRINDIVKKVIPNPFEAIFDYTIKFQKVA